MEDRTFIIHSEWLTSISGLPQEQQDKIISDVVRYGTELPLAYQNDPVVNAFVTMLSGRIDFSKAKYNQKVEMSKSGGRRKKIDDDEVKRLANEGHTSAQIAEILGFSKSAIDHCDGWRHRGQ